MDVDDLRDFAGTCRLFPLHGVVLFPHAVLPLHIFEPRYRQMMEDALAGDKLITMVQLHPGGGTASIGSPPIADVGCLGRILQHERLADGRFNLLLLGCKRVLLRRELPAGKLYRVAEAEILEDVPPTLPDSEARAELIRLFRDIMAQRQGIDSDLGAFLDSDLPLSVLADILAHAMRLPAEVRQSLLAEPNVDRRAEDLLRILRAIAGDGAPTASIVRPFPPPFSPN